MGLGKGGLLWNMAIFGTYVFDFWGVLKLNQLVVPNYTPIFRSMWKTTKNHDWSVPPPGNVRHDFQYLNLIIPSKMIATMSFLFLLCVAHLFLVFSRSTLNFDMFRSGTSWRPSVGKPENPQCLEDRTWQCPASHCPIPQICLTNLPAKLKWKVLNPQPVAQLLGTL